jgi:uracil-DNA glycosylase family 4
MTTPLERHVQKWRAGCGSCLCGKPGIKVVLGKGRVPCDILFVGEAPGESENIEGEPFVGVAGHLLEDKIIAGSIGIANQIRDEKGLGPLTFALTNLVGCLPRDDDGGKQTEPPKDAIKACADRLREFVKLCQPRLVVLVGKLAETWFEKMTGHAGPMVAIMHPAFILRANITQKALLVKRCVVAIAGAIDEL